VIRLGAAPSDGGQVTAGTGGSTLARPPGFRGAFRLDAPARAVYAEAAGIQQLWPTAVAVPADADDVVALVRWAARTRTPLTPRGSGSSMAGGAIGSGVVVDLGGLRELGAIDAQRRRVVAGPGVLRDEVDAAARAAGLRFPVDPSSGAFCTVGGMAATNAAGAHTLRYGAMRRWVAALDCVFADGTRAVVARDGPVAEGVPALDRLHREVVPRLRAADRSTLHHPGVRKDSSGYALADFAASGDAVDLLVGSEGTLAIILGLELSLAPLLPETASLLAAFPTLEAAVGGAAVARAAGTSACELLDRTFLDLARSAAAGKGDAAGAARWDGADAVLLIELEGATSAAVADAGRALERALHAAGAGEVMLAADRDAEAALWELRHAASPALARLDPALRSMQIIEDGAVPPAHLAEYVRGIRMALARHGLRGAIFGHAGDGHVHVNPLIDVRDAHWRASAADLLREGVALTTRLGGTLTGEHGDGRLRAGVLAETWGGARSPAMDLFAAVKRAFDPEGILNPGVKLRRAEPTTGVADPGDPFGAIKYDPSLPPLPAAARAVLDRVAADRAYARPRLALLDEVSRTRPDLE